MKFVRVPACLFLVLAWITCPSPACGDESAISMVNELLNGELSAAETYQDALQKLASTPEGPTLRSFLSEHESAVGKLKSRVEGLGGEPSRSSGPWGVWSKAVERSSQFFGREVALRALKNGEEIGAADYEQALSNRNLSEDVKAMIESDLLPRQRQHVALLEEIISRM